MKYCSNCGTPMEDEAAFCPACGTSADLQNTPAQTQAAPEGGWQGGLAAPPRKKRNLFLWIGIPAAAVVIAAAAVAALLLTSFNPMIQFGRGLTGFFDNFTKMPGNEVSSRMATEPYDVTLNTDLSKIASQLSPDAAGMAGDISVFAGYKANKTDGGVRLSVSSSGVEMFNFAGLITDDELLAGYTLQSPVSESQTTAAQMKLKSKPGDTLAKKLAELYAGNNQKETQQIWDKIVKYLEESVDPNWFSAKSATLTDALTGSQIRTKAAVLTMDSAKTVQLLQTLQAKLEKDPDFFADIDDMRSASGDTGADSRAEFKEFIKNASEELGKGNFEFAMLIHFSGSKPVAIELTVNNTENKAQNADIVLQKAVKGDETAYELKLAVQVDEGIGDIGIDFGVKVDKTDKGYAFDGKYSTKVLGMDTSYSFKGTSDITKKSSSEYDIDININADWNIPYSGTGNFDLAVKEAVVFGASIVPVRQDKNYAYDELKKKATQVATIEDFYAVFSALGIPTSIN